GPASADLRRHQRRAGQDVQAHRHGDEDRGKPGVGTRVHPLPAADLGEALMITAETINSILHFNGDGLPVVSLYARIPPGASRRELRTRVSSLLDEIRPLAKDGTIERERRISVRGDIARIKDALGEERWRPGAVAIFTCSGRGLYEGVTLPLPLRNRVIVDPTPFVRT